MFICLCQVCLGNRKHANYIFGWLNVLLIQTYHVLGKSRDVSIINLCLCVLGMPTMHAFNSPAITLNCNHDNKIFLSKVTTSIPYK